MDTQSFTKDGKYLMLAFDHRGSFRKMIDPANPDGVKDSQIIEAKEKIIRPVADLMSGILVDPGWGLEAYNNVASEGAKKPFLLCTEKSGYEKKEEKGRFTQIQYPAAELKSMGALGVKLLLYFNPDDTSAEYQIEVGRKAQEDCHGSGLPIFTELVSYKLEGSAATTSDLVLRSIKMFIDKGVVPDVWKLEYPDDAASCVQITELVGDVPWILLTRGAKFEVFKQQLEDAVSGGAVGFLAGRALWQEAMTLKDEEQAEFLNTVLPQRFKEISDVVAK